MDRRSFLNTAAVGLAAAALPSTGSPAEKRSDKPTTARIWRGRTTKAKADDYAKYLYEEGVKALEKAALGVQMFREDRADESEFVVISYWESVEAMARYAGAEYTKVYPLPKDPEYLIEMPKSIQVMKIVADLGNR